MLRGQPGEPRAAVIELGLQRRPALAVGSALRNRFGQTHTALGLQAAYVPRALAVLMRA